MKTRDRQLKILANVDEIARRQLRLEAYKKLLEELSIDPTDDSYSGGGDAGIYCRCPGMIQRFAVHTVTGEYSYLYAKSDTFEEAQKLAMDHIDDNVYAETPVFIVDLDTGDRWLPHWPSLPWVHVEASK